MATSKDYLNFVLDCLCRLDGISYRYMMGEYIIYHHDKITAFLCDNRMLVKAVPSSARLLEGAPYEPPFKGAKDMILVEDPENSELLEELFTEMYNELPEPKPKKPRKSKKKEK